LKKHQRKKVSEKISRRWARPKRSRGLWNSEISQLYNEPFWGEIRIEKKEIGQERKLTKGIRGKELYQAVGKNREIKERGLRLRSRRKLGSEGQKILQNIPLRSEKKKIDLGEHLETAGVKRKTYWGCVFHAFDQRTPY